MIFFYRSVLMRRLLLVCLLMSIFSPASAINSAYNNLNHDNESMLHVTDSRTDCLRDALPVLESITPVTPRELLKKADSPPETNQQCHCPNNVITLFPAIVPAFLQKRQIRFLALIRKEQIGKAYSFTEQIDRPPIS